MNWRQNQLGLIKKGNFMWTQLTDQMSAMLVPGGFVLRDDQAKFSILIPCSSVDGQAWIDAHLPA